MRRAGGVSVLGLKPQLESARARMASPIPPSAVKELFIVTKLKERAKANAGKDRSGGASAKNICVVFYPRCRRFAWFDGKEAITKRQAVRLLEASNGR